jgi:hypothetical protein
MQFADISDRTFSRDVRRYRLDVPPIPNIFHWFRKYVVLDLARLRDAIKRLRSPKSHKRFFLACFCSIIRNVSNADPVPVSGLEVTSHMKSKDARGRVIDPYAHFVRVLNRALSDREQFEAAIRGSGTTVSVRRGDATALAKHIRRGISAVITSPPYHNAVDYYRRHTLEMYWLDLVRDHQERLSLLPQYIGRFRVSRKHPFLATPNLKSGFAQRWHRIIEKEDPEAADAFTHYAVAMQKCFASLSTKLRPNSKAIFVIGKSSWNGRTLPTTKLFEEVAMPYFRLREQFWYPIKNRYMTYSRRNGASIDTEHVLVFRRTSNPAHEIALSP